jgi:GNAT superfamily N-acetyltransferase
MANPDEVEQITNLINSSFRQAEGFFVEQDRIDCDNVRNSFAIGKFLVSESQDTLIGCVYVEPRADARAYLGLLAVDLARQQSGLGSLLMDAAEDYARELGHRFMDINVVNLRQELMGFYQRRGYVETGTSPFPVDVKTRLPCHFIEMSKPL